MPTPLASLGFVGYIIFENAGTSGGNINVRATDCDLKLSQAIEKPNVVDSKFDKTVYQLGPKEVGGSISFPAVHEDGEASVQAMWRRCIERPGGRLKTINVVVKYADQNALFRYNRCLVDTFEFSVSQGDVVNVSTGIMGLTREVATDRFIQYGFRNSRIVTWNDANIEVGTDISNTGDVLVASSYVRDFTVTVNNNSDRFYTLNGQLTPQDVAATKRDIDGTMTLMGRQHSLGLLALNNQLRCTETSWLSFGYSLQSEQCSTSWFVRLPGIVFEIEDIGLTNDLLETTVNWYALTGALYRQTDSETFEI